MFQPVLAVLHDGYNSIFEEHLVSMWVHKLERSGQMYDEIRAYFALCFNKAAPTEAVLCDLKNNSKWFCVKVKYHRKVWMLVPICKNQFFNLSVTLLVNQRLETQNTCIWAEQNPYFCDEVVVYWCYIMM
jgi:hypothetical protein